MPPEEKLFWRLFIENEGKRGEMRKTEAYKQYAKVRDAAGGRLEPAGTA